MDFASLMKSQIEKAPAQSKFVKRGDIEAQRREQYAKEQAELEAARQARLDKKRKRDEDEAARLRAQKEKRLRLAAARQEDVSHNEAVIENDIPDEELQSLLKEMQEPRFVFAESHAERLQRYRTAVENNRKWTDGPIPTYLELVEEKDMRITGMPSDKNELPYLRRQLVAYFDMILREWDLALRSRTREVKESASGKQAAGHFTAAVSNLTPLVRKLEADQLPDDILKPVVEIVDLAQRKKYVDANNAYLRLSIGNTAWPIGVTMVGIHERSAREKLHEENAGHVMSDETTRKMIQGVKRSLTFAQTRWPPDDFAQMMG